MTSAEFIVHALTERGLTIACAETLTGGGIAQALIQVPGSSRVLDLGVVAYSDQAKVKAQSAKKLHGKWLRASLLSHTQT